MLLKDSEQTADIVEAKRKRIEAFSKIIEKEREKDIEKDIEEQLQTSINKQHRSVISKEYKQESDQFDYPHIKYPIHLATN